MTKDSPTFNVQSLSRVLSEHLPAKRWLVGFSGGLDSSVLLAALVASKPEQPVVAIHVNHGLSDRADAWQRHCQALCGDWKVECRVEKVQVQPNGRGLEDAARIARYQAFQAHMETGDVLLLGHHRDDQAETLLFRLMRGAGPRGLGSIVEQRDFAGGRLLRPLLAFSKSELEHYGASIGLDWINDDSNEDEGLDRNFLRRRVLPVLAERWPNFPERWRLTAEACQQADQLSRDLGSIDLHHCDEQAERFGWSVDWSTLAELLPHRRTNLLRTWALQRGFAVPEHKHLREVNAQFFAGSEPRGSALVQWSGAALRYYRERVHLTPIQSPQVTEPVIWWLDHKLVLADGTGLSAQEAGGGLHVPEGRLDVRWRRGGERCRPAGRGHSQTLKKLLQEYRLEPWLRDRVPLFYVDGELAAVGDLWICHGFTAENDPGYQLQWYPPKAIGLDEEGGLDDGGWGDE
ncbi:MAG: tRNA lysidine(34) synthetase TilS [Cellvibrionaceae bacterium]